MNLIKNETVKESNFQTEPGMVSILSPGYNSAHFYPTMIESVLRQTYSNWELLILIDKGTTDNTVDIINKYSTNDPRIKLIHSLDGKGLSYSRNIGLNTAKGQYIAFLDSDDLWLEKKLENQVRFMQDNQLAMSCTAFRRISEDLKTTGKLISVPLKINYKTLLVNNVMGCLTVMIDQSKTGRLQMLETKHEDYLLWLSLLKKNFSCQGLNQDLARYRIVKNSRSANKLEMFQYRWKILKQYENLPTWQSFYFLVLYIITSFKKYITF